MTVLTDGENYQILLKQVQVFRPTFDTTVLLLGRVQTAVLVCLVLKSQSLVKHRGEDVNSRSIFGRKLLVDEPREVEVDDDVIEKSIMFQRFVIRHADGDGILGVLGIFA